MFLSFVIAAIYSAILLYKKGNFIERLYYLLSYLQEIIKSRKISYYYTNKDGKIWSKEEVEKTKIHMALPIFLSIVIHLGGGLL